MEIKLSLSGHSRTYEIIHIIRAVFPDAEFSDEGEIHVESILENENIITVITGQGKTERAEYSLSENHRGVTSPGHGVCISFLKCAKKFKEVYVPWGALIGIRPSGMVANFRHAGYSDKEIKEILSKDYMVEADKLSLMFSTANAEAELIKTLPENGVSFYIGVPYCPTRCSYCSFISRAVRSEDELEKYVECLIREFEIIENADFLKPVSIYIGGGTPTVLSPSQLSRVMEALAKRIDVSALREYTVEAGRPDTVTEEKLRVIKELGAGRISINPQTLKNDTLKLIGRNHTAEDFYRAFSAARKVGFETVNTDLIAGLPGETAEDFEKSIKGITGLKPENITVHTLSVKRAAALTLADAVKNPAYEMHKRASGILEGYSPYYLYRQKNTVDNLENTGYSLPGHECIYNMCMMGDIQNIISFGGGGVTKFIGEKSIERIRNPKDGDLYIKTIDDVIKGKEQKIAEYRNSGIC